MTAKIYHGYKVVRVYKNRMFSCTLQRNNEERVACVEYFVNQWVKPNKSSFGPLGVYDKREHAENLVEIMGGVIYECLYRKSKKNRFYFHFVRKNGDKIFLSSPIQPPINTQFASSVMLLKRVK